MAFDVIREDFFVVIGWRRRGRALSCDKRCLIIRVLTTGVNVWVIIAITAKCVTIGYFDE
jgi:hypothetical protein